MKQTFLLFSLLAFVSSTFKAQISINSDDIIPIGYVAEQTRDTFPDASILEGGIGNINWDFMALQPGLDAEFVLLKVDSTPFAASFPDANLATQIEPGLFAYMVKGNDKIEVQGIQGNLEFSGIPIQGRLNFSPTQSLIRFPATFGDSYEEVVVQQGQLTGAEIGLPSFDSVRLVVTVQRTVEIDAYGQMQIPSGNYECIRSTEFEASASEGFVYTAGVWISQGGVQHDTVINYNWWTIDDSRAYPVVSMEFDPQDGSREVTYLLELSDVVNLFESEANLFPNPASNHLNLEFKEPFTGEIQVFNSIGQLALSQKSSNSSFETINLDKCNAGTHYVVLRNGEGRFAGHKKIIITK